MLALVSCIKHYSDAESTEYFLVIREEGALRTAILKSKMLLNVGEVGEVAVKAGVIEKFEAVQNKGEIGVIEKEVQNTARGMVKDKIYLSGIDGLDRITEKLWKHLTDAMLLLARKIIIGAPIMIRFHNDIDGSSGAYALYKAMIAAQKKNKEMDHPANINWRMHGSVSYSREDATTDILTFNNYESVEKPLLVVLDFGTAEESNPGIELIKEKFDIIWLDHHPVMEKFAGKALKHYVNPWNFGGDSNYTAGFLTCVFAKALSEVDTKELESASLIGDYSEYSNPSQKSRKLAALLDLITSDTRMIAGLKGNLNPEDIDKILNDVKRSEELIAYAENRIAEMLDIAINSVKIYKSTGGNVYIADFESIRGNEQERYPLPGRFASKLLGKIEELNKVPCILLLHFGHFVSVRMSKKLIGKVDLLGILESARKDYPAYVEATGGHSNAASIKLRTDEMKKVVIKTTVDRLKDALDKQK